MKIPNTLRLGLHALLAAFSLAGVSCAHKVNYHLTDAEKWNGPTIKKTVQVVNFKDDAPKDEKINFRMGRDLYRINGRIGYGKEADLSTPVSEMIGRHLEHSGLFENVFYDSKPIPKGLKADYVLDGTIYDYHGLGKMNKTAETVVMSGASFLNFPGYALSLLFTKNSKSEMQANVRLNDVKLKNGQHEVWSKESVYSQSKKEDYFLRGDNNGVFELADIELRNAVNYMIYDIGAAETGNRPQPTERTEHHDPKSIKSIYEKILGIAPPSTEGTETGAVDYQRTVALAKPRRKAGVGSRSRSTNSSSKPTGSGLPRPQQPSSEACET